MSHVLQHGEEFDCMTGLMEGGKKKKITIRDKRSDNEFVLKTLLQDVCVLHADLMDKLYAN